MRQLLIWGALSCALLFLGCSEEESPIISTITDDPATWPIIFTIDDTTDFYVTDGGEPGPSVCNWEYWLENSFSIVMAGYYYGQWSPIWIHLNEVFDFLNYDMAVLECEARGTPTMYGGNKICVITIENSSGWREWELDSTKIGSLGPTVELIQHDLSQVCGWNFSGNIVIKVEYSCQQDVWEIPINLANIVIRAR